ncbi:MAG TPA: universal stress protein [Kineosporiaceae bacterium]|nr:universal stress protein [Kineosporiaceae bacterium]
MNAEAGPRSDRVVVGYDGSEPAAAAVDWAAAEAHRRGVPLTVVHVGDEVRVVGALPEEPPEHVGRGRAAAERITGDGVERARKVADDLEVTGRTVFARAASTLVAASKDASLVVVGTRGRGEVTAALLGSVAFAVSEHAHCPVVVVPASAAALPGPDRPVVVGIDTWPRSERPARFAAAVASEASAPLEMVSAYRAAEPGSDVPDSSWALEAEGGVQFEGPARAAALEALAAASVAMHELYLGLEVRTAAVEGLPAQVLADQARGCGLLVVGARGSGGFAGLRLGSIAHAVLHDASSAVAVLSPVAVVQTDAADDDDPIGDDAGTAG